MLVVPQHTPLPLRHNVTKQFYITSHTKLRFGQINFLCIQFLMNYIKRRGSAIIMYQMGIFEAGRVFKSVSTANRNVQWFPFERFLAFNRNGNA